MLTIHPLFCHHAILQSSAATPVWGTAEPGVSVHVAIGSQSATSQTHEDGTWRVDLDLLNLEPGPHDLLVTGTQSLVVRDILIGDVWLCSGQSNMEFLLEGTHEADLEISRSANPRLRHFSIPRLTSPEPETNLPGAWEIADPSTVPKFSAVAYYFGKKLQATLDKPIGLILSSWGGTPSEAWTSREGLSSHPQLKEGSEKIRSAFHANQLEIADFHARLIEWETKHQRRDVSSRHAGNFSSPEISTEDWTPLQIPGPLSAANLPERGGAVWLRKKIAITAPMAEILPPLQLGIIDGIDEVYWNGMKVGEARTDDATAFAKRTYYFPSGMTSPGTATLALRIFSSEGRSGIYDANHPFRLGELGLTGEWLAKTEYALPGLDPKVVPPHATHPTPVGSPPRIPSFLFNAMIHPLIPSAIKGILWYQGESNADRAYQYRAAFRLLIRDWRKLWGATIPFYFCQLAGFGKYAETPGESRWAELREAQHLALTEPLTGEAVLIDVGEEDNIHPRDKKSPGERLAALALDGTYGIKQNAFAPAFDSMKIQGSSIRLFFSPADQRLVARALPESYRPQSHDPATRPLIRRAAMGSLEGFAICGEDRKWYWANATIEENSVVVQAAEVPQPIAARYAWNDNPLCNLYSETGLPATPFRTDDFPLSTQEFRLGDEI